LYGGGRQREGSVPVTLKVSKKFYETFGEQVTNELVDAFNQVDATYRSDLREMNESNRALSLHAPGLVYHDDRDCGGGDHRDLRTALALIAVTDGR